MLAGAAAALTAFAWLLSFHPNAARASAAYRGVYVESAVIWGWLVEREPPDRWDLVGAAVALVGMAINRVRPAGGVIHVCWSILNVEQDPRR